MSTDTSVYVASLRSAHLIELDGEREGVNFPSMRRVCRAVDDHCSFARSLCVSSIIVINFIRFFRSRRESD